MNPLVFLHGWGASGHIWRRQAEAFGGRAMEVLAPTFPSWTVSWLADYLKKIPLAGSVLVGWSLGGMLLLETLGQELFIPAGLVLVAAPASFCQQPDHPWGQPRAVVRSLRRAVREDPRRGLADFAGRCLAPGEMNLTREILQDFQPQANGADLAAGLDYLLNTDLRPRLAGMPAGALIIQGDDDAIVPPGQTEFLQENLKDARMVRIPGAGHAPFLTRALEFNEILKNFLREGAAPPGPPPNQRSTKNL
jgi:pimeloyl-[acyl-carrier protein] methyl ester esterase